MKIGLILVLFTTILVILLLIFNYKIRKITTNYYFYAISAIAFLIYFCIARWFRDINAMINGDPTKHKSVVISKAFLLDLCPFLALALPMSLIFDKTRNSAKILSFFGIVGPGITLYGQIMFEQVNTFAETWEYTFGNNLYFAMHFWVFVYSFIVLQNSKNLSWVGFINAHIFILIYFGYVLIFVYAFGVDRNVTGLAEYDWSPDGEYGLVAQIFNLSFPAAPIVCFCLVWLWIVLMMFAKNLLTFNEENKHRKEIPVQSFLFKKFRRIKNQF